MTLSQIILAGLVLSLPLVGVIAIGRTLWCIFRCRKAEKMITVILASVSVLIMVAILAFDVVVLFGYGVAHTGKDTATGLLVLGITIIPTYLAAIGIWLSCRSIERKFIDNGA